MVIKSYRVVIMVVSLVGSIARATTIDYLNSLVAAPALQDTVVVSGPLVIGIVNDTTGKGIKDKPVTFLIDKCKVAVVPTNKDGVCSYRLNDEQALQDGNHLVESYIQLAKGHNVWMRSTMFAVQGSSRASTSVRSGNVNADNSAINFPFKGADINSSTPIIVGSLVNTNYQAVIGETVDISINGVNIATVTSESDGVFSYQVSTSLDDGNYTVGAHCVQSNVDLAPNSFTILTVPPAAPTITFPSDYEPVDSSTVIVTGTTESYATITTFMDGDIFGDICYADVYGNWSNEYDGLADGEHTVTAQATDLAQNTGPVSDVTVFTVDA